MTTKQVKRIPSSLKDFLASMGLTTAALTVMPNSVTQKPDMNVLLEWIESRDEKN